MKWAPVNEPKLAQCPEVGHAAGRAKSKMILDLAVGRWVSVLREKGTDEVENLLPPLGELSSFHG